MATESKTATTDKVTGPGADVGTKGGYAKRNIRGNGPVLNDRQKYIVRTCLNARKAADMAATIVKRDGDLSPEIIEACALLSGKLGMLLAGG